MFRLCEPEAGRFNFFFTHVLLVVCCPPEMAAQRTARGLALLLRQSRYSASQQSAATKYALLQPAVLDEPLGWPRRWLTSSSTLPDAESKAVRSRKSTDDDIAGTSERQAASQLLEVSCRKSRRVHYLAR